MSTQYLELVGANVYHYQGARYEAGKTYRISDELADVLLDKFDDATGARYFGVVREKDALGKRISEPKLDAVTKAKKGALTSDDDDDAPAASRPKATTKATKSAAKKSIKVGGGKVEGLGPNEDSGDIGGDPAGDDSADAVPV